ncbi:UV radiation resistance associated protein [Wickerhamiella sorbophila]|uniref:Autophagy-related protein 14 n=1 Tax=Wickerhamiella sorbophila TaxID=45607 RepID=A0A2T0FEZ6_9ASCO|nr:UV radiation resistance associated protein [Wickerhamiella sorbophila]PRT53572.1 UV radiation resistance associated protein [Wickerhamiella sorbophila]
MNLRHITGWGVQRCRTDRPVRLVVYADTQKQPVYVSEPVEMPDAEFRGVDLARLGRAGGADHLAVRVFELVDGQWCLLHETELYLENSEPWVLDKDFGSTKGPIVVFTVKQHWMWVPGQKKPSKKHRKANGFTAPEALRPVSSLTYDKLVKLHTLQTCLEDSWRSESELIAEIESRLPSSTVKDVAYADNLRRNIKLTKAAVDQTSQITARLRAEATRYITSSKSIANHLNDWQKYWPALEPQKESTEELDNEENAMVVERRRLIRGLMEIFPIDPIDRTFHFTICGLPMPSVFSINHYDPVQVGAVLGLIAQLVVLLSRYLDVALPYPIRPYGSQSYIIDTVSKLQGSRTFPLWTKGALLYRVEYGLYLLHKNIEQLMLSQNLAVADLKQTLANLKNLMLVCS